MFLLIPSMAFGAPDDVQERFKAMKKAYESNDMTTYGEALRSYLRDVDNADADVAFMYAMFLSENGEEASAETLRWANVAIANRHQWRDDVYTMRLQPLYKRRIEATLVLWKDAVTQYEIERTDDNWKRASRYQQLSSHYFRVSNKCVLSGDCGPYFAVEVDETPLCETIDPNRVATEASVGRLDISTVACLEGLGATQPTMRRWVRDILLDNAEGNESIPVWTRLVEWHSEAFGRHDLDILMGYVRQLSARGETSTQVKEEWVLEALKLPDVPADLQAELRGFLR